MSQARVSPSHSKLLETHTDQRMNAAVVWSVHRLIVVLAASTVSLAIFGAIGAVLGGASMLRGAIRVVIGGTVPHACCSHLSL